MTLHAVTHDPKRRPNRWCGPAAFSILTGLTAEDGARAIRAVTGKASCTRVNHTDLIAALKNHGVLANLVGTWDRGVGPTTAAWLKTRYRRTRATDTYLVIQTTHCIVVRGNFAVDNKTRRPVTLDKATGRRARMRYAYLIVG